MIGLDGLLRPVVARLRRSGHHWAVVGGLAVSARTVPRFTKDIDLAVAVSDDREAEQLIPQVVPGGYRIATLIEQTATGRLATVRLALSAGDADDAVVDLLFASSGIEPEVVAAADPLDLFPGLTVPVATIGHLIALKVLARNDDTRPQDAIDPRALLVEASAGDLQVARGAGPHHGAWLRSRQESPGRPRSSRRAVPAGRLIGTPGGRIPRWADQMHRPGQPGAVSGTSGGSAGPAAGPARPGRPGWPGGAAASGGAPPRWR